jgi:hypothetical protein
MATATKTKVKRDRLDDGELDHFQAKPGVLEAGLPYLWIMGFGWAKVGFYIKHVAPNRILVAHCNHFRNAGKDYGRLATEGAGSECEWRYEGELSEINTMHVLQTTPYCGEVPRGRVIRG